MFFIFVAGAACMAAVTVAMQAGIPQLVPASIALALLMLSRLKRQ
jgi:hypothetical protein|tara:strand:- start:91 stop:225 length:135 start_codon:yes stop_codon:yes gene_type:complete